MDELPAYDVNNAPLEEFIDPNSAIASIINQMQGAANRTRGYADLPVEAQIKAQDPQALIQMLLSQRR